MKKFYVLFVVLSCVLTTTAQTFYWIGPSSGAGGNWDNTANWSFSSGGPTAGQFPNNSAHNVIFDQNALVNVNLENINLQTLTVSGAVTAKLFVGAAMVAPTITLSGTSAVTPALKINATSRLEDSCDANIPFTVAFASDSKGVIDGTWYFTGKSGVSGANGSTFTLPGTTGLSNRVDVNGTIQLRNGSLSPNPTTGQDYLFFNSGSTYWLDRNGGNVPKGTFSTTSTVKMTGVVNNPVPTINVGSVPEIGNLIFDCPGLILTTASLALSNNLVIKGDFQILNTNGKFVVLATNGTGSTPVNANYTVKGNLTVSGNSRVILGNASATNKVVDFQVEGNLNLSGVSFDLQNSSSFIATNTTTLRVKGNINHTAGTFGSPGTFVSNTTDLYILELNGSSNQTITSTGTINNSTNEISLRLNNAAGATLASPLTVGKLSFNSASKGKLTTTSTNVLTIANTGTHALVVNSPSSTGFVNGPVRRATASTSSYLLPTGKGSTYHASSVVPNGVTASVYQGEYFTGPYSDLSVVSPLTGVSNLEYWQMSLVSGTNAAIELTLNGAVPGALVTDAVGVAHYTGADWSDLNAGGIIIIPGNSTSGTTRSGFTAISGFYTFGYGLAGSLPIKLTQFDAKKISGNSAKVSWQVSSSSNAAQFEVLRSADARNFVPVGSVSATDRVYSYGFDDNTLPLGTSYYRLRMTDQQGIVTLSAVVAVLNGNKDVVLTSMVPTAVTSGAYLNISSGIKGTMLLQVTDMYGRIVTQQQAAITTGNQQVPLSLQQLPAGAYQVTAIMNNNRIGTIRFVKQ